MARKRSDHSDFNSLPDRSDKARRSIGQLSDAFEELSQSGTVTHKALNSISGVLGAIPHPAAQGAAVLLSLGSAFLSAQEQAEKMRAELSESRMRASLANFAADLEYARSKIETFRDSMLAGESEEVAILKQRIESTRKFFETHIKSEEAALVLAERGITASRREIQAIKDKIALYTRSGNARIKELNAELAALTATDKKTKAQKVGLTVEERAIQLLKERMTYLQQLSALEGTPMTWGLTPEQAKALNDAANATKAFTEAIYGQQEAVLMVAHTFGTVGADAFLQYENAMNRVIERQNAFSAKSGRAAQNAAAQALRSLGTQAAAQAVFHLAAAAAGQAGFINIGMYGTPQDNLRAAALFGSVAVMAGVGSAALSVKSGGGGGGGNGNRPGAGASTDSGPNIYLTVIGEIDYEGKQRLAAAVSEVFAGGG